jgi:hypothetical protein
VRYLVISCLGSLACISPGTELSGAQADTYQFQRRYNDGESYRYRVTSKVDRNGKPAGEETAVSLHSVVVPRDGIPFERISWRELETRDASGNRAPEGDAEKVPPYEVSLDARGRVDLPTSPTAARSSWVRTARSCR